MEGEELVTQRDAALLRVPVGVRFATGLCLDGNRSREGEVLGREIPHLLEKPHRLKQVAVGGHCGFITYEADIDPEKVIICHPPTARRLQDQPSGLRRSPERTRSGCCLAS